jgi:DNA-binding transcriptional regulator YdaS (Cro superfamily)
MNRLEELNILIDKASSIAGSDSKLARSMNIAPQLVSNWRHGLKTCTPADQALLAHAGGLDPVQVLARATVAQFEGKAKGDALMKALGKASRLTGAVAGFVGAVALAIFSMTPLPGQAQTLNHQHNDDYVKY